MEVYNWSTKLLMEVLSTPPCTPHILILIHLHVHLIYTSMYTSYTLSSVLSTRCRLCSTTRSRSDVTFVVGDTHIHAHSSILKARPEYFRTMLSSGVWPSPEGASAQARPTGRGKRSSATGQALKRDRPEGASTQARPTKRPRPLCPSSRKRQPARAPR